jgi:hypothetical protein
MQNTVYNQTMIEKKRMEKEQVYCWLYMWG